MRRIFPGTECSARLRRDCVRRIFRDAKMDVFVSQDTDHPALVGAPICASDARPHARADGIAVGVADGGADDAGADVQDMHASGIRLLHGHGRAGRCQRRCAYCVGVCVCVGVIVCVSVCVCV